MFLRRYKRQQLTNVARIGAAAAVLAVIGVGSIFLTHAATSAQSFEVENGTVAGNATIAADPNASAQSYVRFGAATPAKRFVSTAAASQLAAATTMAQVQQALQSFASQYNLTIYLTAYPSGATHAPTYYQVLDSGTGDVANTKALGAIFIDEWSKYPTNFVKQSGLKGVVLGKKVYVAQTYRAAVYVNADKVMVYDIGYGADDYMRGVLHHEYWHYIEYNDGVLGTAIPGWNNLNDPSFKYGDGGASCYQPNNDCLTGDHPIPGFVSGYGASASDEDRAEYFAYMMVAERYHDVLAWAQTDSILAKKFDYMKQDLAKHSSDMGGTYLDDINGHIVSSPNKANAHTVRKRVD